MNAPTFSCGERVETSEEGLGEASCVLWDHLIPLPVSSGSDLHTASSAVLPEVTP